MAKIEKLTFKDGSSVTLPEKDSAKAKYLADTWLKSGLTPSGEEVPWSSFAEIISPKNKDLVTVNEVRALLATSTETILREPIEPILAITSLFTRVAAKGLKTEILLGAMGIVSAGEVDEMGTYPEVNFEIGGGITVAHIGKSGIAASFSDEALRYTTWDIMAINLRLMKAAMARYTEFKAISTLRSLGTVLFDNAAPTTSMFGITTGRSMSGSGNGTLTMDDLMLGYTYMIETGYTPDTLCLSPQMYFMWVRDPVLRHLFLQGNGGVYFATYNGDPGVRATWSNGMLGGRGPSLGQNIVPGGNAASETASEITEYSNQATSSPNVPSYFPVPLRIIVSPMLPYDPSTKLGDIYLIASNYVGFRLIDEEETMVEWRNEDNETTKVKLRQRDAFAVGYDGFGIGIFRHVKNDQNFFHGDVQLTQSVSGSIAELDSTTPVV